MKIPLLLSLAIAIAIASALGAAQPSRLPIPCMETGMHMAAITDLATDGQGRIALTCSFDKTARLWSIPAAALPKDAPALLPLGCLRVPVGEGDEGRLLACALAPDGAVAAVGGCTGREWDETACVYLFDTASTRLTRRISGLQGMITSLAFSSSGSFLAVLQGQHGLRIFETSSGRELGRDENYGGAAMSADWHGDDQLVTTCWDAQVRLYTRLRTSLAGGGSHVLKPAASQPVGGKARSSFRRMADAYEAQVRNQKPSASPLVPRGARFSPDGKKIAVGFETSAVAVIDAATLAVTSLPNTELLINRGSLQFVAWQPDGRSFVAGGTAHDGLDLFGIRHWSKGWKNEGRDIFVNRHPITGLLPLPDGRFLWASAEPAWGLVANSASRPLGTAQAPTHRCFDYMRNPTGLTLSDDAQTLSFNYADTPEDPTPYDLSQVKPPQQAPAIFSILKHHLTLLPPGATAPSVVPPEDDAEKTTQPGGQPLHRPRINPLFVMGWDSDEPFVNKAEPGAILVIRETLKLDEGETSHCVATPPDDSFIILGTSTHIRRFTGKGAPVWNTTAPGPTRVVNLSSNHDLVAAAFGDGTIRWYRAEDGHELLAFFPHADQKRWILWTPEGYYDSSEGGDELMGWHLNRSADEAADFFPVSRFKDVFRRSDVIQRVLTTRDVAQAVIAANIARGRPDARPETVAEVIHRLSPPVVELDVGGVLHEVTVPANAQELPVRFRVHDTGQEKATHANILWNGRPLMTHLAVPASGAEAEVIVPLPQGQGNGELSITASHQLASSPAAILRVRHPVPSEARRTPRLYHIAVGVSRLKMNSASAAFEKGKDGSIVFPELTAPHKDADALASAVEKQTGKTFAYAGKKLLVDEAATRQGILDALAGTAASAQTGDVVLFSFSGHGYADAKTEFVFICHDADPARLPETALTGSELIRQLSPIKASVILMLDTCQAGAVMGRQQQSRLIASPEDLGGLASTLGSSEHGIILFSSASESSEAFEVLGDGGVFTHALIEGLEGKAASGGLVTCGSLQKYVEHRVLDLLKGSGKHQTPACIMPVGVPDFSLTKP